MNYLLSFDGVQIYGFIRQSSNIEELITEACNSPRNDLMIYGSDVDPALFQSLRIDVNDINAAKKENISPNTLMLRYRIKELEKDATDCTKRKLDHHCRLEQYSTHTKKITKHNKEIEKELEQVERELVSLRSQHKESTYLILFLERDIVSDLMDVKQVSGFVELEYLIEYHYSSREVDRTFLTIFEHPFSTEIEDHSSPAKIIERKHSLRNRIISEQRSGSEDQVDRCYCFHCDPLTRREYQQFKSRIQ